MATTNVEAHVRTPGVRRMLNKVPEVTLYFWVIKILCTTVGETFADLLWNNLGLGEKGTAVVMAVVLAAALTWQFRQRRYVPVIYWLAVVLISIEGTLITDNLADNFGVSTSVSTPIFAGLLALTFLVWYLYEGTLSIHTIFTVRREAFYWLAILFTFALGTAGGDLTSEKLDLGYWVAVSIFAGAIALITAAHFGLKLNAVLAFWLAYILTRPLGASMGDGFAQTDNQGLGLGTYITSLIFLVVIGGLIAYLSRTRIDQTSPDATPPLPGAKVLVLADDSVRDPAFAGALERHVAAHAGSIGVIVANPSPADWHPLHPERHDRMAQAERTLAQVLDVIRPVSQAEVSGAVSTRHDPMDAVEEELHDHAFDEVIVAVHPHRLSERFHLDLGHRLSHHGVRVTSIDPAAKA